MNNNTNGMNGTLAAIVTGVVIGWFVLKIILAANFFPISFGMNQGIQQSSYNQEYERIQREVNATKEAIEETQKIFFN